MGKTHKFNSNLDSRYSLHNPDLTISSTPNSMMSTDGMILRIMPSVDIIEFGVEDIVRSGLCKEYLLSKMELNL